MTVTFEDLPMDVLKQVVGSTLLEWLPLRKVSPDLRSLVDSLDIYFDTMEFELRKSACSVEFENVTVRYEATVDGGCMVTSNRSDIHRTKKYKDDRNFKQLMLANTSFLRNPNLKIHSLSLFVETTASAAEFVEFLKSLKAPLNVRSIKCHNLECLHSIVPLLKQEKLKEIFFKDHFFDVPQFNEIATTETAEILKNPKLKIDSMNFGEYSDESSAEFSKNLKSISSPIKFESIYIFGGQEEWISPALRSLDQKNVKEIILNSVKFTLDQFNELAGMEKWRKSIRLIECSFPSVIRLEQFVDFKEFKFKEFKTTDESLVTVRDVILKSPHFQKCRLVDNSNEISKREMYEKLDRTFGQDSSYDSRTRRFTIRDSRDYFQLSLYDFRKTTGKIYLSIRRTSEN